MICSERELGLSEDHNGIMVLPEGFKVGTRLIDALDLDTEILEIGITPNRGDCLSVLGLAREAADRVVFMEAGQVVDTGTPRELFDEAKNPRIQAFLSKIL